MSRRAATLIALLAALAALAPATPARAQELPGTEDFGSGDQLVVKGTVYVQPDGVLDDVVIIDGTVRVDGRVSGDLVAVSAPVLITSTGTVEGDVIALSDRVEVVTGGSVGGDIVYADERPTIHPEGTVGGEVRRLDLGELAAPAGIFAASIALWIAVTISSLALGLLLLWLAPRAADAVLDTARTHYAPAIAWGLGAFLGLPVAAILAIVTLVGIPLGLALLFALVPLYALGYTTSAWLLGRIIVGPPRGRALAFLAGWGILRLIALVPFLGVLAWLAATVFGLGALAAAIWRARPQAQPAPA